MLERLRQCNCSSPLEGSLHTVLSPGVDSTTVGIRVAAMGAFCLLHQHLLILLTCQSDALGAYNLQYAGVFVLILNVI